jgi:predicted DNA repair protein MutK
MTGGFFALLDDIASLLDSSATMTKVAAKNTAGVLGDDLAVNAEKAAGFSATREIPVLWAITKGSMINKLIILPVAFLLSAYAPWLIVPILLLGATYLGFEGAEKVWEWITGTGTSDDAAQTLQQTPEEILAAEQGKITSAVRTDFILSSG